MAYARQDKPEKGEPFAARVICTILETAGFSKAYVIDVHSQKLNRFFRFNNVLTSDIFAKEFAEIKKPVIVIPDEGGVERAKAVSILLGCEMAFIRKERHDTGNIISMELKGIVRDKNAIIIDDIIDTGATIISAADLLKENGAIDIYGAATHGLFSDDAVVKLEESGIKK